jgi:hypothetical protein
MTAKLIANSTTEAITVTKLEYLKLAPAARERQGLHTPGEPGTTTVPTRHSEVRHGAGSEAEPDEVENEADEE